MVMAFGWRRFVLFGVLVAALAASFVGRAEASPLPTPTFARSATPAAVITTGDGTLALNWQAIDSATKYRVSWRGRVMKAGAPTARWSKTWSGRKVLAASKRSYTLRGLTNGYQYQLRLESKSLNSLWRVLSTVIGSPATTPIDSTAPTPIDSPAPTPIDSAAPTPIDSPAAVPDAPIVPSCANGRGACVVGDTGPGGGKVFYVAPSSFTETSALCSSSCKYLEAAPVDWNGGVNSGDPLLAWGAGSCATGNIAGANGLEIGFGFANTAAIMMACPDASGGQSAPAARAASTYAPTVGGVVVSGWFLPSRDELSLLDTSGVGVLSPTSYYWSSSQFESNPASFAYFRYVEDGGGSTQLVGAKTFTLHVRPIRAF